MSEEGINELLAALGASTSNTNDTGDTGGTNNTDENINEGATGDTGSDGATQNTGDNKDGNSTDSSGNQTKLQDSRAEKAAAAFATLRTQNKKYETLIKGIAELLEIKDVSLDDSEAVSKALQQKLLHKQAEKSGVPAEILTRLQQLEEDKKVNEAAQLQQIAYLGFQKVKDNFNLSNEALNSFADELLADGINPFQQPVDLLSEYRNRHFDDRIKEAEERGARMEAERATKASQHSTSPNNKNGQTGGDAEKINTVKDLNKFFETNMK